MRTPHVTQIEKDGVDPAVSSGRRNSLGKHFIWFHPAERIRSSSQCPGTPRFVKLAGGPAAFRKVQAGPKAARKQARKAGAA